MKKILFGFYLFTICLGQTPDHYDFVVAKDGSGNYASIADAITACRDYAERRYTIFVKNGIYYEKLLVPSWKTHITIVGQNADSTVIDHSDYSGKVNDSGTTFNTFTSYTCKVEGNDNRFENITFRNSAGRVGQAVALHVEGDRCVFINCRLIGDQDTHFASGEHSRQYYKNCYIEGTTDFIFGAATAYFDSCTIVSKKNSYVTAASTPRERLFGFVFRRCTLLPDSADRKVYLGRPWRLYAYTAFLECYFGPHIQSEGWHDWNKPEAHSTARYYEYQCIGPGADISGRVPWSHQLTKQEAEKLTPEVVLGGSDHWNPLTEN